MIYNVLASGFPLPFPAEFENGVLTYDMKAALNNVEAEIKDKTTIAAGYHLLLAQKDFLINILRKEVP